MSRSKSIAEVFLTYEQWVEMRRFNKLIEHELVPLSRDIVHLLVGDNAMITFRICNN